MASPVGSRSSAYSDAFVEVEVAFARRGPGNVGPKRRHRRQIGRSIPARHACAWARPKPPGLFGNAGANVDTITDFAAGSDKIALDDAIFTGIGGTLNANAFAIGAAAADADDRIGYNSVTGQLFYDTDGNGAGAAVLFASLSPGLALTASDFMKI